MAQATIHQINKDVQEQVLRFGRLLQHDGIPVNKLIIFGSHATRKATQYSDIDVCVVSPLFGKDNLDEMQFLFKERRKVDNRIEPYPASLSEYNELESPTMWEIRKHGLEISRFL